MSDLRNDIPPRNQFHLKLQAVAVHVSAQTLIFGVCLFSSLIGHALASTPSPFDLVPFFKLVASSIRQLFDLDWDTVLQFGLRVFPADLGYTLAVWTLPRLKPASEWPIIWWGATIGLLVYIFITGFAEWIIHTGFSERLFGPAEWALHSLLFAALTMTFTLAHLAAFRYAIRRGRL